MTDRIGLTTSISWFRRSSTACPSTASSGPLGYTRVGEVEGERGETICTSRRRVRGLREAQRRRVRPLRAATSPSRQSHLVDEPTWLAERGGEIESPPKEYTYPAITRSSSTTRTGSSSRSSTSPAAHSQPTDSTRGTGHGAATRHRVVGRRPSNRLLLGSFPTFGIVLSGRSGLEAELATFCGRASGRRA